MIEGRALGLLEIMLLEFYLACTPALEDRRNGAARLTNKTSCGSRPGLCPSTSTKQWWRIGLLSSPSIGSLSSCAQRDRLIENLERGVNQKTESVKLKLNFWKYSITSVFPYLLIHLPSVKCVCVCACLCEHVCVCMCVGWWSRSLRTPDLLWKVKKLYFLFTVSWCKWWYHLLSLPSLRVALEKSVIYLQSVENHRWDCFLGDIFSEFHDFIIRCHGVSVDINQQSAQSVKWL